MRARRKAFTLVELMMVITIMGIIIALILKAAVGGIRRAEEKATIALIAKLEGAMTDRVDAIQNEHPEPTGQLANGTLVGHRALAAIYNGTTTIESTQRAHVIAYYDNLRAELPDVWVYEPSDTNYPCNFGALAFGSSGTPADYALPLGANSGLVPVTGMKGASFAVAAGIYTQLGYGPKGTDGADNNGNGLIDEYAEGIMGLDSTQVAQITTRLQSHRHNTARAEMLYAILVEGMGPLGSSFTRDDFSGSEVADTDGDGLMEFIDAWGQPIQFYRWPVLYHSDTQRGFPDLAKITDDLNNSRTPGPYSTVYEAREVNTLDPNQLLLAPAWWTTYNNGPGYASASNGVSGAAIAFQQFFHTLADPMAISAGSISPNTYWDRSSSAAKGLYGRRAYYNRFLIVSGGPDKIPGVAQLGVNYRSIDERSAFPLPGGGYSSTRDGTGALVAPSVRYVIEIENQGGKVDPNRNGPLMLPSLTANRNDTNTFLEMASEDDITSQNIHSLGGPLQ